MISAAAGRVIFEDLVDPDLLFCSEYTEQCGSLCIVVCGVVFGYLLPRGFAGDTILYHIIALLVV
jgi:hypothetical protein